MLTGLSDGKVVRREQWLKLPKGLMVNLFFWGGVVVRHHRGELNALLWQIDIDPPITEWVDWTVGKEE